MDLFRVIDQNNKKIMKINFINKIEAKSFRNELNSNKEIQQYIVTRSKDHWRGLSSQINRKPNQKKSRN